MKYDFDQLVDRSGTQSLKWGSLLAKAESDFAPLSLSVADMDFPCAQPIIDALHRRVERQIFGYSDYNAPEVRAVVQHWYAQRFDWQINAEHIVFSPGVVPAIAFLIHALTAPGDGVIIQRPVYYPFTASIENSGRRVVNNPLHYAHGAYTMDYADLEQKLADPANKGLLLCSPHNPVGRVWAADELRQVVELTQKYDKWIICDEIHSDLVRRGVQHQPLLKLCPDYAERIIVCTAPSKTFNLAGMQMSNIIIPNEQYRRKWHAITYNEFGLAMAGPMGIAAMMAAYTEGAGWLAQVLDYVDGNVEFTRQFLEQRLP